MNYINGWYFPDSEEHFIEFMKDRQISEYQPEVRIESFKYLKKKRSAIDIGANVGLWARDICKTFENAYLFEPYFENVECLKKNLNEFQNFKIFECALSNTIGFDDLHIYPNALGANTLNPKGDGKTQTVQIKKRKLDDFNFKEIDYIKIDVQFHELEVIEGSTNTLIENDPILCVESARRNESELQYVKKFVKLLEDLNYKIIGGFGKELFFKKKR